MKPGWIRVTHPFAGRRLRQASLAPVSPRLACVKPVASVHPEPGSNSPLYNGSPPHPLQDTGTFVFCPGCLSVYSCLPRDKPATGNCRFFSSLFIRRPQPYILYMVQPPLFLVTACLFYGNLFKELFLFSPPPVFIRKRLQR